MLKDKVVVVTGGAGYIGQSFVWSIIENHGFAIIADINNKTGKKVEKSISDELNTDKLAFVQLDITSKDSIQKAINTIHQKYGRIDALVNNAYPRNKNYGRQFFDVEYQDFCDNINQQLGGYFLTSQQFAAYFKAEGNGNIINISSIYGVIAPKFEIYDNTCMTTPVEYAAIKSALLHLTKYMAKYFKGHNIRVNAISPGGILDTQAGEFIKAYNAECMNKGMLNPKDIVGTLIYLLSDASTYVNGQNIIVDDGFCL